MAHFAHKPGQFTASARKNQKNQGRPERQLGVERSLEMGLERRAQPKIEVPRAWTHDPIPGQTRLSNG
jgi:hypothetical protein